MPDRQKWGTKRFLYSSKWSTFIIQIKFVTEVPEDPPVPIPEVKDKGNSIPGYRTSDPYAPCRYQAKLG